MFVDKFQRQTNNIHPHNIHSRKGSTIKPGHVTNSWFDSC